MLEKRADPRGDVFRQCGELGVLEPERAGGSEACLGERLREHGRDLEPLAAAPRGRPRGLPRGAPHRLGQSLELLDVAALGRGHRTSLRAGVLRLGSLLVRALRGYGSRERVPSRGVERAAVGIGGGQALERRQRVGTDSRDVDLRELTEAARERIERHRTGVVHLLAERQGVLRGVQIVTELHSPSRQLLDLIPLLPPDGRTRLGHQPLDRRPLLHRAAVALLRADRPEEHAGAPQVGVAHEHVAGCRRDEEAHHVGRPDLRSGSHRTLLVPGPVGSNRSTMRFCAGG